MILKIIEERSSFIEHPIGIAKITIPSSCASGPLLTRTSEGDTAIFELYASQTASSSSLPTSSPSHATTSFPTHTPTSSPIPVPTPSPTKCIKWCNRRMHITCHPWQKCPNGYLKVKYNAKIGRC